MTADNDVMRFNQYPYSKFIDDQRRQAVIVEASKLGEDRASMIRGEFGHADPFHIAEQEKIDVIFDTHETHNPNYVKFAEYRAKKKTIILNAKCIDAIAKSYDQVTVKNIILAHELFHHFECTRWGLTSKKFRVPVQYFGIFTTEKPILLAAEIAADAFAKALNKNAISAKDLERAYFTNIKK